MNKKKKIKILIATGGSGGHIFPAQALARFLKKNRYKVFLTGDKKYENYASYCPVDYKIVKSGKSLRKLKDLRDLFFGFVHSLFILLFQNPKLVIGFGGYPTVPVLTAAVFLKKDIILHEQNSYMGKVNHFFGKHAKVLMTAYHEMYNVRFDDAHKIQFVGNPVRQSINKLRNSKYKYPAPNKKFNILILGGSGGAEFFSKKFIEAFKLMPREVLNRISIVQQCRSEDFGNVREVYRNLGVKAELKTFFTNAAKRINNCHLAISRAGATFTTEVSVIGRPMILFPSPNVKNDHQTINAKNFKKSGSAIVISEKEFDPKIFSKKLAKLIDDKVQLSAMAQKVKEFAVKNAEENILQVIRDIST